MSTPKHKPYENTKLEAAMHQANMAPKDLANAAGLSASAIGRALHWASDKPVMLPSSIRKLCQALHRTPAEIGLDMYDTKINITQAGAPHVVWSELPEAKQPELTNFTYPKIEDEGLSIPKDLEDTEEDLPDTPNQADRVPAALVTNYVEGLTGRGRASVTGAFGAGGGGSLPDSTNAQCPPGADQAILTYEKQLHQALVDARAQVVLAQERYDVVRRLVTMLGIGEAATEQAGN